MILKKSIIGFIALTTITTISAQTNSYKVDLPQLLPASPEPTAFVKAGVGNVNMSTGAASANIPLYTIKLKDFSFPISLSYSTQGLKADEASSRVGYGWVLNATAMITRVVKGKPDEFAERMTIPSDFTGNSDSLFNYCSDASNSTSGGDSQPDEFQFNCNGYSGKFVLDDNYVPRITSTANIKIDISISVTPGSTSGGINTIVLTTPDGIKYTFGNNYEITTAHNIMAFSQYKLVTKTAFFLDRIDLPTGDNIVFNYTPITTTVVTGYSQTLQVAQVSGPNECSGCSDRNNYTSQEDQITYNTKYLNNITTSDGLSIDFSYEQRPDGSNDNRLKTLYVGNLKQYQFDYYDVPIPNGMNIVTGRFFLIKIHDIDFKSQNPENPQLDYTFSYNNLGQVPLPINFGQDYLGFYNGKSSNNCLIPPNLNSNNTIDFSYRDPNPTYSVYGTLSSISYPTGGTEEYFYEANTQALRVKRNTNISADLTGSGGGTSSVTYHTFFTAKRDQSTTMSGYCEDGDPNDGFTEDPMAKTVKLNLYDGTTIIASRQVLGYGSTSTTVNLLSGHTYKLEMIVTDYHDIGHSSIIYDSSAQDIYDTVNSVIPGVRLKQIKYTDPAASSNFSKYFKYASLEKLQYSSGGLAGGVDFHSDVIAKSYCGQFGEYETDCHLDVYSSSSTNDVYGISGSGSIIYYNTVIESDDPNFQNGGTEYVFYPNESGANHQTLLGQEMPYLPQGQYPTLSGVLYQKITFDKNKQVVQSEQDDYETQIYLDHSVSSIYVRKRYEPWPSRSDRMDAFDAVKMLYGNYWNRLKTKTVTTYSGATAMTQQTNYSYGTSDNIQPSTISTTDSKGIEIKAENKYPTDFPTDAVYSKMITKNEILPAVLQSSYKNGTLQQQKKTIYKDWFSDSKVLMPDTVQVQESPSDVLHNALIFDKYDNTGNALELKKANDISIGYIWDYVHHLPICEVKNATSDQIAYCGFETASNYGNWQISSGSVQETGFTGGMCFTGTLTKNVTTSGKYIVSLWTTAGGATVNGTSGTTVTAKRGWTLYRWILVNPTTITIQGTSIDDVRLYPVNAMMTTYTYIPFIGVSTVTDPKDNVVYYEYDGRNRLARIRDIDNNIIKQFEYRYQSQARYYNVVKSGTFTKNNCPTGGTPNSVTYTVAAGTYSSALSQAAADQLAQDDVNANGQSYANDAGTCTFFNVVKSGTYSRNNCATGGNGSSVTYTIPAGTYSSTISQADADQKAQDDVNTNGQTYANTNGVCTFYSVQKSGTFTKNDCTSGGTGSSVTYTVAAGAYSSTISQTDADAKAQNDVNSNGQSYANGHGYCTWWNQVTSGTFTKNNCASGGTGSSVTYTVAAGTYSSTVSQAAANTIAQNDVNANGQTYANNNGTCTWWSIQKSGTFARNNCGTGGTGSAVTYTVIAGAYSSTISQADADAKAQNDVNTNGQLNANEIGTCTYYNVTKSGTFTRNNCPAGYTASSVTYTVNAGTYSSTISQADADAKAQNDVNTNGQTYANTNGTCTYTCSSGNCSGPDKKCISNVCETGTRVNTSSVYMKNASQVWVWRCTYHYVFSDCSVSVDYTEDNSSPCSVGGGCGGGGL